MNKANMPLDNARISRGFTLVEVMISIVVSMVVLGGLMTSFIDQSSHYKYQNSRIDSTQDLEFALKFIEEDLRSALVGVETISITPDPTVDPLKPTKKLVFKVWDPSVAPGADGKAIRVYKYSAATKSLKYDREGSAGVASEILPNVTFFKVVDDYSSLFNEPVERSGRYTNMPGALPLGSLSDPSSVDPYTVSGYTVILELEVESGFKGASYVDIQGRAVANNKPRVWRYIQVYPSAVVE